MRCYLFDLDGTLCNIDHRLHFIVPPKLEAEGFKADQPLPDRFIDPPLVFQPDWDAFYAACVGDSPIKAVCDLVLDLNRSTAVIFATGRSEVVRRQTQNWLMQHISSRAARAPIYMRPDGDHRADHIVKGEMLDEILADGYQPIMAFDDRDQVVKMWRSRGIVCGQVAEGNF